MSASHVFDHGPVDNDPLSIAQTTELATWGLPSDEGLVGQSPAMLRPSTRDYGAGITHGNEWEDADAGVGLAQAHVIALSDAPLRKTYEAPHEATHRRYEAPFTVPIAQSVAGFTLVAAPRPGLHYIKVLACMLTMNAAGTLKFVHGATDGSVTGDLTGASALALNGGFVLPPAEIATPWLFTTPDQALGIFTVTGLASGFVTCCYSPYDQ